MGGAREQDRRPESAKLLRKIGDGPRCAGQLQDVHAGVGAIDNIDIPAVVHFDVICLNRHLTGFPTACDRDTALGGLLCNRRDVKGHLLGTVRITDIHSSHAGVEVGDEDEASVIDRRKRLIAGVCPKTSTALVQLNGDNFLFYNKSLGDLNVEKFTHKHPRSVDGVNDVWHAYPHSSRNLHDIGIARKLDWRLYKRLF